MKSLMIVLILLFSRLSGDDYYYKNHQQISLSKISSISRSKSIVDYYQTDDGNIVGVSDKLILKLKKDNNLKRYLLDFNLSIQSELSKEMYLLKTDNKNLTINISNRLSEKSDVEYAHPDFIQKRELR